MKPMNTNNKLSSVDNTSIRSIVEIEVHVVLEGRDWSLGVGGTYVPTCTVGSVGAKLYSQGIEEGLEVICSGSYGFTINLVLGEADRGCVVGSHSYLMIERKRAFLVSIISNTKLYLNGRQE